MKREIIINVEKLETRVAVVENGRLEEYMVEHPEEERLVGSVFKGRVQNLENDLQAAFEAAHSLKGVLGNLALTPLLDPVKEITELLRSKTEMDYSELLATIAQERDRLAAL
jgi:hypothetical protein